MGIISGIRFEKNIQCVYKHCNKIKEYALGQGDIFTIPFGVYLKSPELWTSNYKIIDIKKIRLKRKILWFLIPEITKTMIITLEYTNEEREDEKTDEK